MIAIGVSGCHAVKCYRAECGGFRDLAHEKAAPAGAGAASETWFAGTFYRVGTGVSVE